MLLLGESKIDNFYVGFDVGVIMECCPGVYWPGRFLRTDQGNLMEDPNLLGQQLTVF